MKKYMIFSLMAVLFLSVAGSVTQVTATDAFDTFPPMKYGQSITGAMIPDIDPHQAWDSASIDVIDQVCEPLFGVDLRDPNLGFEMRLATDLGTWSVDKLEYTVPLRENVTFHNGAKFNATVVEKSFDRLTDLCDTEASQLRELYAPLGNVLLINDTVVVSNYVVKFKLNYVYIPFEALLTFSGSYMLEPAQMAATFNATSGHFRLMAGNTVLLGTGPYVLEEVSDAQLTFTAYEDYWRALPNIREMHWVKYTTADSLAQAFLAGDMHCASGIPASYIAQCEANPNIIVHPKMATAVIQYIGFNCGLINKTMRQAISYAVDYEYLMQQILKGNAIRMTSIIPGGMKYHIDCDVPIYNITHARKILVDALIAPAGLTPTSADAAWTTVAASTSPIMSLNFTFNLGNTAREQMATSTRVSLEKCGIKLVPDGLDWSVYLDIMYNHPEKLGMFFIGWAPDYNDPSNFLNPLLMSTSAANHMSYNVSVMDDKMQAALGEADDTARGLLYEELQHIIAEDEMPFVHLNYGVSRTMHTFHLANVPRNPMSKLYFYEYTYINPPSEETTVQGIPGYGLIPLIGICALSIAIILKKHH